MADSQARKAAIKRASQQVRAGGVYGRASSASKLGATSRVPRVGGTQPEAGKKA
jgi:hypothetical protein